MSEVLFISDLHLSPQRPEITQLFLRFLNERAVRAEHLYILGDLFDAWVGDDDDRPPIPEILTAMKQLFSRGVKLYFIAGNRDFLVSETFAEATGCQLLPETHRLPLAGCSTLLMHGDLLCTDDVEYMYYRKQLRSPAFIHEFLAKPITERLTIAAEYRKRSMESVSLKAADIVDANQRTVAEYMRQAEALLLIHGHTHRPASHSFELDGAIARRIVLPEWHANVGGYISVHGDAIERHVFL